MDASDVRLEMTCEACPEQYDAYDDRTGELVGYLRLRWGYFQVRVPGPSGEVVYESDTIGEGAFDADERDAELTAAKKAIARACSRPRGTGDMESSDVRLEMTCEACPEQYDAYDDRTGEIVGYLRLRHGYFQVRVPGPSGEVVYESEPRGDGCFYDDEERDAELAAAKTAIARSY